LLRGRDDAPSQLVAIWDREARGKPLTLILSGSEVSTIERLTARRQPLFGRADWSDRLRPFDYFDAARMTPGRPLRDLAYLYGVFGGVPRYLAAVRHRDSIKSAAVREMLSPTGSVHLQQTVVIEQERGIRKPADYRSVLTAVADGRTTLNAILQAAGLGDDEDTLRRALTILEDMEIVGRGRNFGAHAKAAYRYRIIDNAVLFWHRFVVQHRSRLAVDGAAAIWDAAVAPHLDEHMGLVFERMVAQAFPRIRAKRGLAAAADWGRWEGLDRHRRPIEIEIVARLIDGAIVTGEIKWSNRPRGADLFAGLERDLTDLADSGHGWAREALTGHFLFASAAGFDRRMHQIASENPRVHLIDLATLYDET
jgi:AAA+ ATPase superfamily predicted ATPase